jgi:DNA-binding response OmpR family regulator
MKLLIVEDENSLANSIADFLKKEELVQCNVANTYHEALKYTESNEYDCILLDLSLPDGTGLNILKKLKMDKSSAGILIISARNTLEQKIEGLNLGADDYITKPFHLSELNARIKSILRRRLLKGETVLNMNEIRVLPDMRQVFVNDSLLELTPKEYNILLYFISNKNRVVTKESLMDHLWEDDPELIASHDIIYAHIKNLRHKMMAKGGKDYIKTVYGIGYKLSPQ